MSVPSPAFMAQFKRPVAPEAPKPAIIAKIEPTDPGKIVRPGFVPEVKTVIHDGVVKTKHLQPGQRVRPWVHGEARGSERIIASVTKIDDGSMWHVEFASLHPAQDFKAAYRWCDESLDGAPVDQLVKVPGFVSYQEV